MFILKKVLYPKSRMTYLRPIKRTNTWISITNNILSEMIFWYKFEGMFKRSPNEHKKLDFETTIKILLHAIYEELPSYRKLDGLLWINGCAKKSASIRFRIALCFVGGRKWTRISWGKSLQVSGKRFQRNARVQKLQAFNWLIRQRFPWIKPGSLGLSFVRRNLVSNFT